MSGGDEMRRAGLARVAALRERGLGVGLKPERVALQRRAEAADLTRRAIGGEPGLARAALARRDEARVADRVAQVMRRGGDLGHDGGDPGPVACGRGSFRREIVGDGQDRMTPLGMLTAVRTEPRVLARMSDALRRAARIYADAVEAVAARGRDERAGGGGGRRCGDGGATARCTEAEHWRRVREAVGAGALRPGHRAAGRVISDLTLVHWVCARGLGSGRVLRAHGWQENGRTKAALALRLAAALGRIADAAPDLGD